MTHAAQCICAACESALHDNARAVIEQVALDHQSRPGDLFGPSLTGDIARLDALRRLRRMHPNALSAHLDDILESEIR